MRLRVFAAAVVCGAVVAACGQRADEHTGDRYPALGTLVEITVIERDAREGDSTTVRAGENGIEVETTNR